MNYSNKIESVKKLFKCGYTVSGIHSANDGSELFIMLNKNHMANANTDKRLEKNQPKIISFSLTGKSKVLEEFVSKKVEAIANIEKTFGDLSYDDYLNNFNKGLESYNKAVLAIKNNSKSYAIAENFGKEIVAVQSNQEEVLKLK